MRRASAMVLLAFLVVGTGVLMGQQPPAPNPAANNRHLGNPESIRSGMALYRIGCADCHGLDASGYRGPDLIALMGAGTTDERLFQTIRKGVPGTEMPPAPESTAPDDDLLMIIAYLRKIGTVPPTETPTGNVDHGQQLFAARCASCHRVAGKGGRLGPDLTRIGASRSRTALAREIRTPSEWIAPIYETVTVVEKNGQRTRGTKKNEDVYSIQIMDTSERIRGYLKSDLQQVIYEKDSLMPAFDAARLNDSDLNDLIRYLGTLRGVDLPGK